jgi:hypothetical protein
MTDNLDRMLAQHFRDGAQDEGEAATRVLDLLRTLPPQQRTWRHWPSVLLAWDLAPAWPRVAALACCAVLGFAVGVVGPSLRGRDASFGSPRGDFQLASLLSDPEPITGVLP